MAQNITLLGASYSTVPAVLLPKTGGGTARFDDATITTATASDVASGKVFLASDGTITTGTSKAQAYVITVSWNAQQAMWLPDKTYAEAYAAYTSGETIVFRSSDERYDIASGYVDENLSEFEYTVLSLDESADGAGYILYEYAFNVNGIRSYGINQKYYSTFDADAVPSDVANGKTYYGTSGRETGTSSGGGGSSLNVQIDNTNHRISGTTYIDTGAYLKVAVAGTYDIYWSAFRSSTSSGTNGTRLYKNSSTEGSAFTSWENSYAQTPHLSNITLAKNDELQVYARASSNSRYVCVGNLTIIQKS